MLHSLCVTSLPSVFLGVTVVKNENDKNLREISSFFLGYRVMGKFGILLLLYFPLLRPFPETLLFKAFFSLHPDCFYLKGIK